MFNESELFDQWWSGVRDALNPTAARFWARRGWDARGRTTKTPSACCPNEADMISQPPAPEVGRLTATALAAQLEDLRTQLAALETRLANHIGTSAAAGSQEREEATS